MKLSTMLKENGVNLYVSKTGDIFVHKALTPKEKPVKPFCQDKFEHKKLLHNAFIARQQAGKKHKNDKTA